jgi:cytochrome c5
MMGRKKPLSVSIKRPSLIGLCLVMCAGIVSGGCPSDMREQPSFSYQEAPRLHSPQGSIPQGTSVSHWVSSPASRERGESGARLFAINCEHCHGPEGTGDGPVAGFLPELPANLQAPAVQRKPEGELYDIVTHGQKAMPAFAQFLSREEREALLTFIKSLKVQIPESDSASQGVNPDGERSN